jgi:PAS domain S-box-containing protein
MTSSIFLVLNKKGQIAMINKAGSELLGLPENKLKGENWFNKFIPLTKRKSVREIFGQMMKGEAGISLSSENLVIGKNGDLRLIEWHNTILKDKSGRPEATLSSGVDITRKRALEIERTEALVIGQENERRRLAQELHDGLGQSISAIGLNLNSLEPELKHFNEKFKKIYDEVRQSLNQTIDEVRTISRNLTPHILEDFGLPRALEHLFETIDKSTTVELSLSLHGDLLSIDKKAALGLYRIIQELLNNALKHAEANHINVHVTRARLELIGIVEDDGHGFDVDVKSQGMGLSNVESRAQLLKGEIHIDSCKKSGTSVSINIPL